MDLSEHNFSPVDEQRIVREHFAQCLEIFKTQAYVDEYPISCQINDAFGNLGDTHHNCLGCNFADTIQLIHGFLKTGPLFEKVGHAYTTYILLTYLLVERLDTLFKVIQLNPQYREANFRILMTIRRWANFIKHPKAFLLTHHAEYTFVGSPKYAELHTNALVTIDRKFVDKFYSNDDQNRELFKELQNAERVLVVFPDAMWLTTELCAAMHKCVELLRENAVYRYVLEERSTFQDYFLKAQEEPSTSAPRGS